MQIIIDLPSDVDQDLIRQAAQFNIPLQALIEQALRKLAQSKSNFIYQWSDIVLSYEGSPDFPAFESYRDELIPPSEPELF